MPNSRSSPQSRGSNDRGMEMLKPETNGASVGISWRELAFIGPFVLIVIYGALDIGSIRKQVQINTDDKLEMAKTIATILQHDSNTTARLENVDRIFNDLRKTDENTRSELLQRRAEFPTQFQFNEYKQHADSLIIGKLSRDTFDAWKGQNDRTVELLQRQIEDINRQIAASVLQQQIKPPERPLSLVPDKH